MATSADQVGIKMRRGGSQIPTTLATQCGKLSSYVDLRGRCGPVCTPELP